MLVAVDPLPVCVEPLVAPLVVPVAPDEVPAPVVPVALVLPEAPGLLIDEDADVSSVPVTSTWCPTWPFSLSSSVVERRYDLPAAEADVLPEAVPEVVPEPAVPVADELDGDVLELDALEPAPVAPDVEVDAPAGLILALLSVQLPSEPRRQPETVTVDALLAIEPLCEPLWEPLVPVGVSSLVLCESLGESALCESLVLCVSSVVVLEPLCAATPTAKAQANATLSAGPNTRFMCSSSWMGVLSPT